MLKELRNPHGIRDVGLAAGHVSHVSRVHQHHIEFVLEDVVDRLPVDAGAFHGDVLAPELGEPVTQLEQVTSRRSKGTARLRSLPVWSRHDQACTNAVFVNIETTATLKQTVHARSFVPSSGSLASRFCSACSRATFGDSSDSQRPTWLGLAGTTSLNGVSDGTGTLNHFHQSGVAAAGGHGNLAVQSSGRCTTNVQDLRSAQRNSCRDRCELLGICSVSGQESGDSASAELRDHVPVCCWDFLDEPVGAQKADETRYAGRALALLVEVRDRWLVEKLDEVVIAKPVEDEAA